MRVLSTEETPHEQDESLLTLGKQIYSSELSKNMITTLRIFTFFHILVTSSAQLSNFLFLLYFPFSR